MEAAEDTPADLISLHRASQILGVARNTVRSWVLAGKLPGWQLTIGGNVYRVSEAQVRALLKPAGPRKQKGSRPENPSESRGHREATEYLRKHGVAV
jgi:excisionase family DNA binding protein